jgi:peptide/nickel transport system permease protein
MASWILGYASKLRLRRMGVTEQTLETSQGSAAVATASPLRYWRSIRISSPVWRRFLRHRAGVAGLVLIVIFAIMAVAAPLIAPYTADAFDLSASLAPPSAQHWFGTDPLGRDIFSRCIYGARISLTIGLISVGIGLLLGLPVGAVSGFAGRWVDRLLMRGVDILLAFPTILTAIIVISIFGPGLRNAMLAIGIAQTPIYVRVMRSSVLKVREELFVDAARAIGSPEWRILVRHVIPNALHPIIVQGSLSLAAAILSAAYLGFLGLGAQPPTPEWGSMLSKGRDFLRVAPHASIFPGLFIMAAVLSLNLLGDGLCYALDPKFTRR